MEQVGIVPDSEEEQERHVEGTLALIVTHSDDSAAAEPRPGNEASGNQAVACRTLVDVEHQSRVKCL